MATSAGDRGGRGRTRRRSRVLRDQRHDEVGQPVRRSRRCHLGRAVHLLRRRVATARSRVAVESGFTFGADAVDSTRTRCSTRSPTSARVDDRGVRHRRRRRRHRALLVSTRSAQGGVLAVTVAPTAPSSKSTPSDVVTSGCQTPDVMSTATGLRRDRGDRWGLRHDDAAVTLGHGGREQTLTHPSGRARSRIWAGGGAGDGRSAEQH